MTVPYTFANQTGTIPLAELDANFAAVPNYANTAGTVTQAVQPNITTVGTLTNLNVASTLTTNYLYQTSTSISLGNNAGNSGQSANIDTIAIGNTAGGINQSANGIAIGSFAGSNTQGTYAVGIGRVAGFTGQASDSVAIGHAAGQFTQSGNAVAIGYFAGNSSQGYNSIAIGSGAGSNGQGDGAIAVGKIAGYTNQGANAIAYGRAAGNLNQGIQAVAIGQGSGQYNQGNQAIAIGLGAGANVQGNQAIAIGALAGNINQGSNAIAIGAYAGYPNSADNSIALNGARAPLDAPLAGFYVKPVRNDDSNITSTVYYNTTSGELTYSNTGSGYGNAQVAAFLPTYSGSMLDLNTVAASGNIIGNYFIGNGSQLTGITTSSSNIVSGASSINIPTPSNNISVTVNGTTSATFFTSGMSLPGNVTAGNVNATYFYGNGSQLTGVATTNSRVNVTITTGSLASNAAANIVATGYKGYALYSITSNNASWVTLYTSNAAAVSDYTRTINTDPTPGSGVVAEAIGNAAGTVNFTPAVIGFNNETVPTVAIPMKVVNNGNTTTALSVTLTLLKMEG